MSYINQTLTFESDKIYYYDEAYGGNFEVFKGGLYCPLVNLDTRFINFNNLLF